MSNFFTVSVNKNKVKITITTSEIRLEVENTHHEIRKYTLEEIKKFIKDKTGYFKGTGLGLAIAKEFVESQGGKIWVESLMDSGSQFHFILPIASS